MRRWFIPAAMAVLLAAPAWAEEDLVSGLSQDTVLITSNYTGTDLVIFGAIEQPSDSQDRDIVVVVRGPDADMTVRRKDRFLGVWINNARARLGGVPSYYYLASTRPLSKIASADTLARYDLGLPNLEPEHVLSDGPVEPYRAALVRAQLKNGLYTQDANGIEMLSANLFRVHVPMPATVSRGQYTAQVYLFRDGVVVSAQSNPLFVDRIGFERRVYAYAHESPFSYGLLTVLLAMLLGWISSLVFRRIG
jgi:uncharacterized protein (TIGR02186 family)